MEPSLGLPTFLRMVLVPERPTVLPPGPSPLSDPSVSSPGPGPQNPVGGPPRGSPLSQGVPKGDIPGGGGQAE